MRKRLTQASVGFSPVAVLLAAATAAASGEKQLSVASRLALMWLFSHGHWKERM